MSLSPESVAYLASQLGHELTVYPSGPYAWAALCKCGYRSTRRRTQGWAMNAAVHHQEVVIVAYRASGKAWPVDAPGIGDQAPADDTPDEHTSERRTSVVA
jgi:hypothetical protein